MSSSDVSSVTNYFSTAFEGFTTTLSGSITAGATSVPLTTTSGLTNGAIFVGIVEPGTSGKEQTFTGTVDTGGSQITGVVWTRGTNTTHSAGVTVVDYVTGTSHNMMTKGILKQHTQTGAHTGITTDTITTTGNASVGGTLGVTGATTLTGAVGGAGYTTKTIAFSGASVSNSANQSVATSTVTSLTFDTEDYDTDSYHSTSSNTGRLTAPVTGYYNVHILIEYTNGTSSRKIVTLNKNGVGLRDMVDLTLTSAGGETAFTESMDLKLTAGDYLSIDVYQDSGGTLTISTATKFQIKLLGV